MKTELPFFSVILPVYNGEAFLYEALYSVLSQSFKKIEVLAVDDGSTDGTAKILSDAARDDDRLQVVTLPENRGLSAARNAGIEAATGKYLIFMDADDVIGGDCYAALYGELKDGAFDLAVFGLRESYIGQSGGEMHGRRIVPGRAVFEGPPALAKEAAHLEELTLFGYAWNKAYAARIVRENGLRFENTVLIEDFLFNLDFLRGSNRMITLDIAPYVYRIRNASNLTARFEEAYYGVHRERIARLNELLAAESAFDEMSREMLANRFARYILSSAARNFDPASGMGQRERREFLRAVFKDDLFVGLKGNMSGPVGRLMNYGRTLPISAFAFVGRLLRQSLPSVFSKVKKYAR